MFDSYVPSPAIRCPRCAVELRNWQGKDGPCCLVVWQQGAQQPRHSDLDVDEALLTLPDEFLIYADDCECFPNGVDAVGRCVDGIWRTTELTTAAMARRWYYFLRRAELAARVKRLEDAGL